MASAYLILGQAAPATSSNLFTVPSAHSYIVSTLVVANTTTSASTVRVHARLAGAAAATSNAVVYDASVPANSTVSFTLGMTFAATDILTVVAGTSGALTVTAFGSDIS
jgi:hypothetical protein